MKNCTTQNNNLTNNYHNQLSLNEDKFISEESDIEYSKPFFSARNQIFYIDEKKSNCAVCQLTNFVAAIINEYIISSPYNNTETRYYLVGGITNDGEILKNAFVKAEEFEKMTWIAKQWSACCSVFTIPNANALLSQAIKSVPVIGPAKRIDTYIGWQNQNSCYKYVLPLEVPNEMKNVLDIPDCLKHYSLNKSNSINSIANKLLFSGIIPNDILVPILATEFLSPLIESLNQTGYLQKVSLCLFGKTGIQKSSIIAVLHSLNGNFTASTLPLSFDETPLALHQNLCFCKDTTAVIDDYYIDTCSSTISSTAKLDAILKSVADNAVHRTKTDRINAAQCNVIITAEQPVILNESRNARIINIQLKPGDVDKKILTDFQENYQDKLSSVMQSYINYIGEKMNSADENFSEVLKNSFIKYRSALFEKKEKLKVSIHDRLLSMSASLCVGYETMLAFFEAKEILNKQQSLAMMSECINIMFNSIADQEKLLNDNKVSVQSLKIIESLLTSGKYTCCQKSKPLSQRVHNCLIRYDDKNIYIYRNICFSEINKLAREINLPIKHNARQWIEELDKDGFVVEKSKNIRFGEKVSRVDILSIEKCKDYLDITKFNPNIKLLRAS